MAAQKGNKYALGNNGGRPAHFETPEELIARIDEYFEEIRHESHMEVTELGEVEVVDKQGEPATITGLCLFLGFSSRNSLYDYEKRGDVFSGIIKKARMLVEHEYEKCLYKDKPTGAIFALKNMGWADKTITEHSGEIGNASQDTVDRIAALIQGNVAR